MGAKINFTIYQLFKTKSTLINLLIMKQPNSISQTLAAWRSLPPAVSLEQVQAWVRQQPPVDLRDRHWMRVFWDYLFSKN